MFRTDKHRNPCAITTDLAKQAGLKLGKEYEVGDPFPNVPQLTTAKFLGDPIAITLKVIDKVGFYTKDGRQRWSYIAIPKSLWDSLLITQQLKALAFMYQREGGTEMKNLFSGI